MLATVANSATHDAMATAHGARGALPTALADGFGDAFLVGAGIAVVAVVVAALTIRGSADRPEPRAEPRSGAEPA